jgi:ankyrin repeat protein
VRKPGITIIVAGLLGMVAVFCLIASTIWNEALRGTNLTKDLQVAMIMGNIEWVRQLMDKGANPNAASLDGATMIQLAADLERPEIVKVLIDRGAKVDIIGAACVGDVERVESFIKEGNINTTTPRGKTPLMCAAEAGYLKVVTLLLVNGVEVDAKDNLGSTALMKAAEEGQLDIVKLLMNKGADVNLKDKSGFTSLISAALREKSSLDVFQLLLDRGAQINAKSNSGLTALAAAMSGYRCHPEIIKLLLENGADVNTKDIHGYGLMITAIQKDCPQLV